MPHFSLITYIVNNALRVCIDYIFPPDKLELQLYEMTADDFAPLHAHKYYQEKQFRRLHLFNFNHKLIQRFIHLIKYEKNKKAVTLAGEIVSAAITKNIPNVSEMVLCPTPQSTKRKRERGYNQCKLLTDAVFKNHPECTYIPKLLRKTKHTKSQTNYSRVERLENLKHSIAISEAVISDTYLHKKTIVVIDDVYTTGATTTEIRRTLEHGGFHNILIITLAWA